MLGARTKHVVAYGRRGHRIVNDDDHENTPVKRKSAKALDVPHTPVIIKTKMAQLFPSETPSPPARRVYARNSKPKRLSSALSPSSLKKKRTRMSQIADNAASKPTMVHGIPFRAPLGSVHPNVPSTPVPTKGKKKAQTAGAPGLPLAMKKPFSPFVDVDIITLDNDGRRVSQERRVSRTDVVANPVARVGSGRASWGGTAGNEVIEISDDDNAAPKPTKRGGKRRNRAIVSSDESEIETVFSPPAQKPTKVKIGKALTVEVVIPIIKPAVKPRTAVEVPQKLRTKPPPPEFTGAGSKIPVTQAPQLRVADAPTKVSSPPPSPKPAIRVPRLRAEASTALPLKPSSPNSITITLPHAPRARPLTPIRRGGASHLFRAPTPPSPTTPTDLDSSLGFDFENLSISSIDCHSAVTPTYLLPLLDECEQHDLHEFSAFIETFPFDPIVQPLDDDVTAPKDIVFRKIGEASYSEVFGIGNVVLKVIPLRDETVSADSSPDVETPFPSDAKDVLKEMIVTRAVGEVCDGFVKLLRTYIVRGRYPELLLSLWDEYDAKKGSEGVRPDGFNVSQAYAIIVLPNGGPDLEAYTFTHPTKHGWRQATSLFWQIASTLSRAEDLVEFEHRDLHWGQILVRNTVDVTKALAWRRNTITTRAHMNDICHGVEATIIDLGLARMNGSEGVHWTPFDAEIFEGEGDYQFDVYRMMKSGIGEGYRPATNVMWLHYLAMKLLHSKQLKPAATSRKSGTTSTVVFSEKECYDSLVEVEGVLAKSIKQAMKKTGKKSTKVASNAYLCSAGQDIASGSLSRTEWCKIFISDLAAIGVNNPPMESFENRGGSLSFPWTPRQRNDLHHKRYLAVVAIQNTDLRILDAKSKRNIGIISYGPISKNDRVSQSISQSLIERTNKRDYSQLDLAGEKHSSSDSASPRKRMRSAWPIDATLKIQKNEQSKNNSDESEIIDVDKYPTPPPSATVHPKQRSETLKPIKTEEVLIKIPSDPPPASSTKARKASRFNISLASITATAPPPAPRINPLHTYGKKQAEINRLTRELWDIRREMSAFAARELNLVDQLEKLGADVSSAATGGALPPPKSAQITNGE
ncbi:hypothetical protein HWV62_23082 [Athelia sp. TMB]|nr:hypothetical protein HWV62_23082 [Athelia sp. TMB]